MRTSTSTSTSTSGSTSSAPGGSPGTHGARFAPLLGAGVLGIAVLAALQNPASAAVQEVDHPRVTASHHDFGKNWVLGAPVNGGDLAWDVTNGVTTPVLSGYHYLTDRECGKVLVEYFDDAHTRRGTRSSAVRCAPGSGKTQWWTVIDSFSSTTVTHAHVSVQRQNANGSFTTMATDVETFG